MGSARVLITLSSLLLSAAFPNLVFMTHVLFTSALQCGWWSSRTGSGLSRAPLLCCFHQFSEETRCTLTQRCKVFSLCCHRMNRLAVSERLMMSTSTCALCVRSCVLKLRCLYVYSIFRREYNSGDCVPVQLKSSHVIMEINKPP